MSQTQNCTNEEQSPCQQLTESETITFSPHASKEKYQKYCFRSPLTEWNVDTAGSDVQGLVEIGKILDDRFLLHGMHEWAGFRGMGPSIGPTK